MSDSGGEGADNPQLHPYQTIQNIETSSSISHNLCLSTQSGHRKNSSTNSISRHTNTNIQGNIYQTHGPPPPPPITKPTAIHAQELSWTRGDKIRTKLVCGMISQDRANDEVGKKSSFWG